MKSLIPASRPVRFIAVAAIFLVAACAMAGIAVAQETSWRAVASSAAQYLAPGGEWQPLSAETPLSPNSEVKVGVGGRVVLQNGGDTVTLSPNSHMKIPSATPGGPSILQKLGTLLYRIEKRVPTLRQNVSAPGKPLHPFNVETPYLAAVIKGTVFSINVSDQGAALHVAEGLVEAFSQATGERGLVAPGQTARVSALAGAEMTISNGGKVQRGNRGQRATATEKGKGANDTGSQGPAVGRGNGTPKGLKVAVGAGLDIGKASKGLLKLAAARTNANVGKGISSGNGKVPGHDTAAQTKTPGQMTAGVGNAGSIPGVLPNGNTFHGNGNAYGLSGGNPGGGNPGGGNPGGGNPGGGNPGNGNPGGNNGGNGCNGNGNKPGC